MNISELNYPTGYAPMPIKKILNYEMLSDTELQIIGFVAAPCYVISEKKTYFKNGNNKIQYEVVFSKTFIDNDHTMVKDVIPEYNFYGECINSFIVSTVGDDYLEIKKQCIKKNIGVANNFIGGKSVYNASQIFNDFTEEIHNCYNILEKSDSKSFKKK